MQNVRTARRWRATNDALSTVPRIPADTAISGGRLTWIKPVKPSGTRPSDRNFVSPNEPADDSSLSFCSERTVRSLPTVQSPDESKVRIAGPRGQREAHIDADSNHHCVLRADEVSPGRSRGAAPKALLRQRGINATSTGAKTKPRAGFPTAPRGSKRSRDGYLRQEKGELLSMFTRCPIGASAEQSLKPEEDARAPEWHEPPGMLGVYVRRVKALSRCQSPRAAVRDLPRLANCD
jgi:hypothetical protein